MGSSLAVRPGFSFKELPDIIMRSGQITGMLCPLIAISVVMQQILSLLGAKAFVTGMLANLGGYYPILFACMAIVLIAGTILESLPNTIILAPILAPIAARHRRRSRSISRSYSWSATPSASSRRPTA